MLSLDDIYVELARTVYLHRMYGDFPAKNAVYTPYLPMNVRLWPTLHLRLVTKCYE